MRKRYEVYLDSVRLVVNADSCRTQENGALAFYVHDTDEPVAVFQHWLGFNCLTLTRGAEVSEAPVPFEVATVPNVTTSWDESVQKR